MLLYMFSLFPVCLALSTRAALSWCQEPRLILSLALHSATHGNSYLVLLFIVETLLRTALRGGVEKQRIEIVRFLASAVYVVCL